MSKLAIALLVIGFAIAYRTAMRAAQVRKRSGMAESADFLPISSPFEDIQGSDGEKFFGSKSDFNAELAAADKLRPGTMNIDT